VELGCAALDPYIVERIRWIMRAKVLTGVGSESVSIERKIPPAVFPAGEPRRCQVDRVNALRAAEPLERRSIDAGSRAKVIDIIEDEHYAAEAHGADEEILQHVVDPLLEDLGTCEPVNHPHRLSRFGAEEEVAEIRDAKRIRDYSGQHGMRPLWVWPRLA